MKSLLFTAFILCIFLSACDNDNDYKAKEVNKDGSVEVALHTTHLDSLKDLLVTHYVIWNKGKQIRTFDVKDTIPALGTTNTEGENDAGQTMDLKLRKDYDFFVTVK